MRLTAFIGNCVLFVCSLLWFRQNRGWEPAIVAAGFLGTGGYLAGQWLRSEWHRRRDHRVLKPLRGSVFTAEHVPLAELPDLYNTFVRVFGTDIAGLPALQRILRKNPYTIWRVGLQKAVVSDGEPDWIGFFELFPLRKRIINRLVTHQQDGRYLRDDDICSDNYECRYFYIASVGIMPNLSPKSIMLCRAGVLRELFARIEAENRHRGITLFTRPVTNDGLRLVRRYGFRKVSPDPSEMEAIWSRRLTKGEAMQNAPEFRRKLQAS